MMHFYLPGGDVNKPPPFIYIKLYPGTSWTLTSGFSAEVEVAFLP